LAACGRAIAIGLNIAVFFFNAPLRLFGRRIIRRAPMLARQPRRARNTRE